MMRLAKPIFLAVLAVALAAYAFDCGAATTPEQAMHAPFVQPSAVHSFSYALLVFAMLPATGDSHAVDSSNRMIAAHCHAPPILYAPAPLPLRI